jgi:hypothetical protein
MICITVLIITVFNARIKNKQFIIRYHKSYQTLLNFYLDTAYETIWKTQIIGYYNEGLKPSGAERETMARNFCKTVIEFMGSKIEKFFIEFYGSESALWSNVINYFEYRLDNDEVEDLIKKSRQQEQGKSK